MIKPVSVTWVTLILAVVKSFVSSINWNRTRSPIPLGRCGDKALIHDTRPCSHNDTYCGRWRGRYWHPIGCEYELMSPHKASICLANRTIAFVGDSQIRDLCIGLVHYLLGNFDVESAPDHKLGRHHNMLAIGDRIANFEFWKRNVPPPRYNG